MMIRQRFAVCRVIQGSQKRASNLAVMRTYCSTNHNDNKNHMNEGNQDVGKKQGKLTSYITALLKKSKLFDEDDDLIYIIAKTTSVAAYSMMGVTLLGTFGVDTKPFIAGIGVTGFAAGFAMKEIATNYISGVLLVVSKPFKKGQYIKVLSGNGLEGEVESVEIRHVVLKTKDGSLLMVPSAFVYSNPILIVLK